MGRADGFCFSYCRLGRLCRLLHCLKGGNSRQRGRLLAR